LASSPLKRSGKTLKATIVGGVKVRAPPRVTPRLVSPHDAPTSPTHPRWLADSGSMTTFAARVTARTRIRARSINGY
jgi:hypothetical protein